MHRHRGRGARLGQTPWRCGLAACGVHARALQIGATLHFFRGERIDLPLSVCRRGRGGGTPPHCFRILFYSSPRPAPHQHTHVTAPSLRRFYSLFRGPRRATRPSSVSVPKTGAHRAPHRTAPPRAGGWPIYSPRQGGRAAERRRQSLADWISRRPCLALPRFFCRGGPSRSLVRTLIKPPPPCDIFFKFILFSNIRGPEARSRAPYRPIRRRIAGQSRDEHDAAGGARCDDVRVKRRR